MQSGLNKTKKWLIETDFDHTLKKDVLMGWNSSSNTEKKINLSFDSLDDALKWCEKNQIQYKIVDQTKKVIKPKSYASNFSSNRRTSWTH